MASFSVSQVVEVGSFTSSAYSSPVVIKANVQAFQSGGILTLTINLTCDIHVCPLVPSDVAGIGDILNQLAGTWDSTPKIPNDLDSDTTVSWHGSNGTTFAFDGAIVTAFGTGDGFRLATRKDFHDLARLVLKAVRVANNMLVAE